MATDLKPHAAEIIQQFTDLYYGKYRAEQWGIQVGYDSLPDFWVNSQMQLLQWQLSMDCNNILCTLSGSTPATVVSMASGTADTFIDQPCCPQYARFKPL